MGGFSYFLQQSLTYTEYLLFAAYACTAVRVFSPQREAPIVRFLLLIMVAAMLTVATRAWGGALFSVGGRLTADWTLVLRVGFDLLVKGVALGVALRASACPWRASAAPLVACVSVILLIAGLLLSGAPIRAWGVSMWAAFQGVWHAVCALWLYLMLRADRAARQRAAAEVCCSRCGYALTGLASPTQCPECGARFGGGVAESA